MKTKQVIEVQEWNEVVEKTYGRPYNLQQQGGCQDRGEQSITVPYRAYNDYYADRDSVPEDVDTEEMGVRFGAWLARHPKQKLSNPDDQENYCLRLWWERNFYPDLQMVANDLHAKGLLEAGNHTIVID